MRFDQRAESYDAHAAPQKRFAEALAAFAPFRRGVRVTELGAGTGAGTSGSLVIGQTQTSAIAVGAAGVAGAAAFASAIIFSAVAASISEAFRGPEGAPFGAEQSASDDASPADQLAAFLGRTV